MALPNINPLSLSQPAQSDPLKLSKLHGYPPAYTIQPNATTLAAQLKLWSELALKYYAFHRLFETSVSLASTSPLFRNEVLKKRMSVEGVRLVFERLVADNRAEWVPSLPGAASGSGNGSGTEAVYIYWKTKDEWGDALYSWADRTAQRGVVLTLFEILEEENGEWRGMSRGMLESVLKAMGRRGRCVLQGSGEEMGVKFI